MIPKRTDMQLALEAKEFRDRMIRRGDYPRVESDKNSKVPITKVTNPLQQKP